MRFLKRFSAGLVCSVLVLILLLWTAVAQAAESGGVEGIDVSQWQGDIDFSAVKAAGIEIVYIKACQGDDEVDPNFEQNYIAARAAGLKVGFYHYVTAVSVSQAESQAQFFYSLIQNKTAEGRPSMDFEAFGNLPGKTVNQIAAAYLSTLEGLIGEKPMIYSDEYDARTLWDDSLAIYPLWVADYSVSAPADIGPWQTYAAFQYTDAGSVAGVPDDVDRDLFYASAFAGSDETNGASPRPPTAYIQYTVRCGDTLWALSLRYDTTVAELAAINHIPDPNFILIGQVLRIPVHAT